MKTVLITGDAAMPPALRELVDRGSTSLDERRASDLGDAPSLEADRLVFWAAGQDPAVARLVERYARREAAQRREVIVFVTAQTLASSAMPSLPANEVYVWPRDEDRLKMAFLTGA